MWQYRLRKKREREDKAVDETQTNPLFISLIKHENHSTV
jgi:hypothetical protein